MTHEAKSVCHHNSHMATRSSSCCVRGSRPNCAGRWGVEVCGCIILGVSIWIRVSKDAQEDLSINNNNMFVGVDVLIAVGSIIMILGFLGCCGAIKESRCMLLLFFIGLLLILILQVTGGILGAVYKPQLEEGLNLTLTEAVNLLKDNTENAKQVQESWQKFQLQGQCCGLVNGASDWGNNINLVIDGKKVCECEQKYQEENLCIPFGDRYIFKQPCKTVILDFLQKNMDTIMGIAFGMAVIEMDV
uniref:Tetraspanin n=1 Tax=Meleagris gallopavo TaxID=9103 RepID=A0A803YBT2_MELGA